MVDKIIPHLWFNDNAKEAVDFYVSIFKNSKIKNTSYYGESGSKVSKRPVGSVLTIVFELNGQEFMALNGGPLFKFNESISFIVMCEDQKELDYYWEKLSYDPKSEQCGWLKDKYGLSWQIVPKQLEELINGPNKQTSEKVMSELLKMKKIDINKLKQVFKK